MHRVLTRGEGEDALNTSNRHWPGGMCAHRFVPTYNSGKIQGRPTSNEFPAGHSKIGRFLKIGGETERHVLRSSSKEVETLQASGANVFLNGGSPKFAAQAIRKASDIGWRPHQFLAFISNSIGAVLTPAGIDKSVGLMSIQFLKDASDPRWSTDPGVMQYLGFLIFSRKPIRTIL